MLGFLAVARDQGKTHVIGLSVYRFIGLSNFDGAQLKQAQAVKEIVSLQPLYSALWRKAAIDLAPRNHSH
jgi:aryl-alcohol dehydrogenase-like predicted oxidoreductase